MAGPTQTVNRTSSTKSGGCSPCRPVSPWPRRPTRPDVSSPFPALTLASPPLTLPRRPRPRPPPRLDPSQERSGRRASLEGGGAVAGPPHLGVGSLRLSRPPVRLRTSDPVLTARPQELRGPLGPRLGGRCLPRQVRVGPRPSPDAPRRTRREWRRGRRRSGARVAGRGSLGSPGRSGPPRKHGRGLGGRARLRDGDRGR